MQTTSKGLRLHIGIFGRRNAGKSSLLNAIVRQNAVIVSDVPGTTTDPVEKAMELLPLGPVLFIDTAGVDDDAAVLGSMRVERSMQVISRCDIALLVCSGEWSSYEEELLRLFRKKGIPVLAVFNKSDLFPMPDSAKERMKTGNPDYVCVSAKDGSGMASLREHLIQLAPEDFLDNGRMLGDLVRPFETVLFITPIDKQAPKGRLILPQVQAIRDALDHDAMCVTVKENAVMQALANMKTPPVLAVTDSQVFGTVSGLIPESVPLTSFSILLARLKGDLAACAAGAAAIGSLKDNAKILIAEACAHPPAAEDIGTVKIPRLLQMKTGKKFNFTFVRGQDFPANPSGYDLVIHCGACTFNRRGVLSRILSCSEQGVPFTNYGVCLAYLHGILHRALTPFPEALRAYRDAES